MKIIEFRMPLPMRPKDYHVCQLYLVAKSSIEDTKAAAQAGTADGVKCLVNEEFDKDGWKGQYTHKEISVASKVPGWITAFVDAKWLVFEEKSWNGFPRLKTAYECKLFPKMTLTMESMHYDGVKTEENALQLSSEILANRKIVDIDIVNDYIKPSDYVKDDDPALFQSSKIEGMGPFQRDWMSKTTPMMTCYKVLSVDLPYFGFLTSKVEQWVATAMQDLLFKYHRKAVCWMDDWYGMTLDDIRVMEERTAVELQRLLGGKASEEEEFPQTSPVVDEESGKKISEETGVEEEWSPEEIHIISLAEGQIPRWMDLTGEEFGIRAQALHFGELVSAYSRPVDGPPSSQAAAARRQLSVESAALSAFASADAAGRSNGAPDVTRTGFLYKMGEGLFSTSWNIRFVLLRGSTLMYFSDPRDPRAKDSIDLTQSVITWAGHRGDRKHSLVISFPLVNNPTTPSTSAPPSSRRSLYFSGDSELSTKQWILWLQLAAVGSDLSSAVKIDDMSTRNNAADTERSSLLAERVSTMFSAQPTVSTPSNSRRASSTLAHVEAQNRIFRQCLKDLHPALPGLSPSSSSYSLRTTYHPHLRLSVATPPRVGSATFLSSLARIGFILATSASLYGIVRFFLNSTVCGIGFLLRIFPYVASPIAIDYIWVEIFFSFFTNFLSSVALPSTFALFFLYLSSAGKRVRSAAPIVEGTREVLNLFLGNLPRAVPPPFTMVEDKAKMWRSRCSISAPCSALDMFTILMDCERTVEWQVGSIGACRYGGEDLYNDYVFEMFRPTLHSSGDSSLSLVADAFATRFMQRCMVARRRLWTPLLDGSYLIMLHSSPLAIEKFQQFRLHVQSNSSRISTVADCPDDFQDCPRSVQRAWARAKAVVLSLQSRDTHDVGSTTSSKRRILAALEGLCPYHFSDSPCSCFPSTYEHCYSVTSDDCYIISPDGASQCTVTAINGINFHHERSETSPFLSWPMWLNDWIVCSRCLNLSALSTLASHSQPPKIVTATASPTSRGMREAVQRTFTPTVCTPSLSSSATPSHCPPCKDCCTLNGDDIPRDDEEQDGEARTPRLSSLAFLPHPSSTERIKII